MEDPDTIKPTIPDYYWDKHAHKGKRKSRGWKHWYENCKPRPYKEVPCEKYKIDSEMVEILDNTL